MAHNKESMAEKINNNIKLKSKGLKKCSKCNKIKKLSNFYLRGDKTGYSHECYNCHNITRGARRYNITEECYKKLLQEQKNCAICNKKFNKQCRKVGKMYPRIDHNHKTKQIRQLLCNNCNLIIGYCEEDIEILKSAIEYLIKWNTTN